MASLTFVINQGLLAGTVAGKYISMRCASGGGGGAVDKQRHLKTPDDVSAVNNPFKTGQQTNHGTHVRGGALPTGEYKIEIPSVHAGLGMCARLNPVSVHLNGRGGFYIHGQGPKGSDGCVVPLNPNEFHSLIHGLTSDHGGILTVEGVWDAIASTSALA